VLKTTRFALFFHRLLHWEYWPWQIANLPVIACWLFYALRARSLFFFSAVNPTIETGGLFGESKINILRQIPEQYLPATLFFSGHTSVSEMVTTIRKHPVIGYPLIVKPNIGERGLLVEKIRSETELISYLTTYRIDLLIQEFIDYPIELAVMHHRFPGQSHGKVTSICMKETLKVTGDGRKTVRELMQQLPRARFQINRFEQQYPDLLNNIPKNDEVLELEPIGNHSRGTQFLNGNPLINERIHSVFNQIGQQMEQIHYGRFDIKCKSLELLEQGEEIKILEYNGVGAEPAHVYDPAIPVWKKYLDFFRHWRILYQIYRVQKNKRVRPMHWKEVRDHWNRYQTYLNSL
jgi:hypothetical protein